MTNASALDPNQVRRVGVLVATMRRPEQLSRLLDDLRGYVDAPPVGWHVRVVVCDNDPGRTAENVCRAAAQRSPVEYVAEPRPGIAAARNRLLDSARDCDAVAFIDDDERPCGGWLGALLTCMDAHEADVVSGAVLNDFATPPPQWVRSTRCFRRPRQPTGTAAEWPDTANVLIRVAALGSPPLRFDERYGVTGGSDTFLFLMMKQRGARIIWCDEAVVEETVPPHRTTLRWILRRSFRIGTTHTWFDRDLDGSLRKMSIRAGKGAGWIVFGAAGTIGGIVRLRTARIVNGLEQIAWGAGILAGMVGYRFAEYRQVKT